MERFNEEVRDREKAMRGLKRKILTGYQIYHNYIREHHRLENKTHVEYQELD